jgi:hypothetical protein
MGIVGSSPDKVSKKPVPEAPSGYVFIDAPVQSLGPQVVVGTFSAVATCAYCTHALRWNQYYEFCRCCGHYCHTTSCLNYVKLSHPGEPAEMVQSEYVCGTCCKTRHVIHNRCGKRMLYAEAENHVCLMQEVVCEVCRDSVLIKDLADHELLHRGAVYVDAQVLPHQTTPFQSANAVSCMNTVNPG